MLNGHVVRVADDGVKDVLDLVEKLETDMRSLLLKRLDVMISEHPERVPPLDMIDRSHLRRTVGTSEPENPSERQMRRSRDQAQ